MVNILVKVESQSAPNDEAKKTVLEEYIRQYRKFFKMSKTSISCLYPEYKRPAKYFTKLYVNPYTVSWNYIELFVGNF